MIEKKGSVTLAYQWLTLLFSGVKFDIINIIVRLFENLGGDLK
jgi:hypothetical protein